LSDAQPTSDDEPRLVVLDTTPSTNDVAWRLGRALPRDDGEDGRDPGTAAADDTPRVLLAVLAKEQTAGRGRAGRTWSSPRGVGLYLSLYLRPHWPPARAALLTLAAGLAVREACALHGAEPTLKWPNDLLAPDGSGRKLAGILTETKSDSDLVTEAVIGVGMNLRPPAGGWPEEIAERVATLSELLGGDGTATPASEELAADVIAAFDMAIEALADPEHGALATVHEARRASDLWGRRVRVEDGSRVAHGVAKDWAEDGGLVVRLDDGRDLVVHAGDVHVAWDAP
jgi:BirA family biotin operon repressor/biotin-[acetyl-CoA-carboxylase] ligase